MPYVSTIRKQMGMPVTSRKQPFYEQHDPIANDRAHPRRASMLCYKAFVSGSRTSATMVCLAGGLGWLAH